MLMASLAIDQDGLMRKYLSLPVGLFQRGIGTTHLPIVTFV
jgi:hypothetical protein